MSSKLITPIALLSYPHLHAPQPSNDGKQPKYSACLIFTPEVLADPKEKAFFDAMKEAATAAIVTKFGADKVKQLVASDGFKKGFRTDAAAKGYPEGSIYVNVRSVQQPGIVYAYAGEGGKPAKMPVDKIKDEMYPGAKVRASVSAFAYDNNGNRGVSFGLNNIQLVDGNAPRLDGRVSAENEFDVDLSQTPASLEDLI